MKVEIWFEFASSYSYLTVSRAERLMNAADVTFEWRPFLLGPIFRDKGLSTSPFVLDPIKGAYMWRDVERRASRLGLAFNRPSFFPMNGLYAARIMTAIDSEKWAGSFARLIFDAQFVDGKDISDEVVLANALSKCDADPIHWLTKARTNEVKAKLRSNTEIARTKGVFGAPSFVVGEELFWGDDRLEDAINWAKNVAN